VKLNNSLNKLQDFENVNSPHEEYINRYLSDMQIIPPKVASNVLTIILNPTTKYIFLT